MMPCTGRATLQVLYPQQHKPRSATPATPKPVMCCMPADHNGGQVADSGAPTSMQLERHAAAGGQGLPEAGDGEQPADNAPQEQVRGICSV